jgi:ATP-binding cassette subfamily B protein
VLAGELGAGALVAFAGWMALLVDAAQTLTERLATRGEAIAAGRLAEVLSRTPVVAAPVAPRPLAGGAVSIEGVSVYRCGRRVLDDVSLALDPGRWMAVVGPSGAGKSSLLRLLPRLADPDSGRITLGGTDIAHADPADLRRLVAWVPQSPVLLSGTLAENLRLGAPGAPDEELLAALEALDAQDVLERLGGLGGRVGQGGLDLSGGQRQRVALARAALGRPVLLALDDPTSAVDPGQEANVLAGLRWLRPLAAAVVATHRWAAAAACDDVVLLEGGRVVERVGAQCAVGLRP